MSSLHNELWPWFDPGSRLFILNILSALVISVVFLIFYQKQNLSAILSLESLKHIFKNYWFHKSAQVDYQIYIINGVIKVILFAPVLGLSVGLSSLVIKGLYFVFPFYNPFQAGLLSLIMATVFAFVWDDFLRFFHHYLMHQNSWLWSIHKTHHSAEVLTPVTLFRIHPLESLQASFRNVLSFGLSGGLFMFLFSGEMNFIMLLGVNAFAFIFNLTTGNLRHSHIPISFGHFEHFFISPKQHQIHHSLNSKHFNKNFGVSLSVWDKLFGTFLISEHEEIKGFGVQNMSSDKLSEQFLRWPKSRDLALSKTVFLK